MPYRVLSLEEFSKMVGIEEHKVMKLAERGELPAEKVGNQWRFNHVQTTEWLQQNIPSLNHDRLVKIEKALSEHQSGEWDDLIFTDLLGLSSIDLELYATSRASVLKGLVSLAEQTGLVYDSKDLLKHLQQREELCSTAVGNGIAIPHPRHPLQYAIAEPFACIARVDRGIGFGAPDGGLTHLFFLICSQDDKTHLHVLARLVRILDTATSSELAVAETAEDVLQLLIAREEDLVAASS